MEEKTKRIRPLGDRVIVKRDKDTDMTPGGLHIPDSAKSQEARGVVIEVGPGRILDNGMRVEPQVKKGDRVVFSKYAGQEHGQRYEPSSEHVILREDDIFGVVD